VRAGAGAGRPDGTDLFFACRLSLALVHFRFDRPALPPPFNPSSENIDDFLREAVGSRQLAALDRAPNQLPFSTWNGCLQKRSMVAAALGMT
jgi:hypothetical protein